MDISVKLLNWHSEWWQFCPSTSQCRLSFARGFTCHCVNMTTCCNTVPCHWEYMARDLVFRSTSIHHGSFSAPPARLLMACRKWPSPHLIFIIQQVINRLKYDPNTHTHTHISPHCPQVMSVLFQFPICVWPKMATWGDWWMLGLCGQWPTWMLACDWWLHPSLQCHYSKGIK